MEARDYTIRYLTEMKRKLMAKRDKLMVPVHETEAALKIIVNALEMVLRDDKADAPQTAMLDINAFPSEQLKGMTQMQAVVEIARYFSGILHIQTAKAIMVHAGIVANTKNAKQMVKTAIVRTGKFEHVGRGDSPSLARPAALPKRAPMLRGHSHKCGAAREPR